MNIAGGFDLLCDHCSLGSLLDSNERYDPPRCAAETREAIMQELMEWITSSDDFASILWLHGSAGVGKSAVAQTLAELCRREGRLVASFFFSRTATNAERSDGNRLLPTIVYQLIQAFPDVRASIETYINHDPAIFDKSRSTQMDCLIIKPLSDTGPQKSRSIRKYMKHLAVKLALGLRRKTARQPQLILIDGLDECQDPNVQCDLLKVIAEATKTFPLPFRILIASRPEPYLRRVFDHDPSFRSVPVHRLDLSEDRNVDIDIRRFLVGKFVEIHETHPLRAYLDPFWPSEEAIAILVQKSSPQFIYVATAIRYIQSPRHRPDERLDVILGISATPNKDTPFADLDALYKHICLSVNESKRDIVWRIFGILCLSSRDEFSYLNPSISQLEEIFRTQAGGIELLLDTLHSLLLISESRSQSIKVLHASLFDYLLDASRSGELQLHLSLAHEVLARYHFDIADYTISQGMAFFS